MILLNIMWAGNFFWGFFMQFPHKINNDFCRLWFGYPCARVSQFHVYLDEFSDLFWVPMIFQQWSTQYFWGFNAFWQFAYVNASMNDRMRFIFNGLCICLDVSEFKCMLSISQLLHAVIKLIHCWLLICHFSFLLTFAAVLFSFSVLLFGKQPAEVGLDLILGQPLTLVEPQSSIIIEHSVSPDSF